jgi:hypothetical protein
VITHNTSHTIQAWIKVLLNWILDLNQSKKVNEVCEVLKSGSETRYQHSTMSGQSSCPRDIVLRMAHVKNVTEPPQKWGVCLPRSYRGILDEARMRKHTHKHTIPNMKFKLKLLHIKCHVLGFTKDRAQKVLQRIIRVFAEAFISHDRHTLFALEESGSPWTTYTCESQ